MKVSQLPPLTLTSAFCTYFSTEIDKGVVDTHTHERTHTYVLCEGRARQKKQFHGYSWQI